MKLGHVQLPKNGEKYHDNHDENTLRKMVYGPTYVPYNEDGQNYCCRKLQICHEKTI